MTNTNILNTPTGAGKRPEPHPLEGLMDPRTCAAYLAVSVLTLSDWRAKRRGPAWVKLGTGSAKSAVRYKVSDVQRWLDAHAQGGA
jgi:hypothetical protein